MVGVVVESRSHSLGGDIHAVEVCQDSQDLVCFYGILAMAEGFVELFVELVVLDLVEA